MRIILDDKGRGIPDIHMNSEARKTIDSNGVFHVCNLSAIIAMRAELCKIPVEKRPSIEWEFYGLPVTFDDKMCSDDAWKMPQVNIEDNNVATIYFG